jgi:pyruvate,water dikinase
MPRVVSETAAMRIAESVRAIEDECRVALGSAERVAQACAAIRMDRDWWQTEPVTSQLERLAGLLPGQTDARAQPLFTLVEEIAARAREPWRVLEPMLRVGAPDLRDRAAEAVRVAVADERLTADAPWIAELAALADGPAGFLRERPALEKIAAIVGRLAGTLYAESTDLATRRLAARVLDLRQRPPSTTLAIRVVGRSAHEVLAPYLDFTRATHVDLLAICPRRGEEPEVVRPLREAERQCGRDLLLAAIASIGWSAVNRGIEVRRFVGVSLGGAFPLQLSSEEAALFDGCPGAARVFDRTLIIAHGAEPDTPAARRSDPRVARFRACNVAHARVLAEFLNLTPLTRERVRRLVNSVGGLVDDFMALFGADGDEGVRLQAVYSDLERRITSVMGPDEHAGVPSEVARLVQPFEDPESPEAVRTIHGLKRYLHQRGLRLAFRLVDSGRDATRRVTLVVASEERILNVARPIEYADFEADTLCRGVLPYGVAVVVDGFARQLIHGEYRLPSVRIFCYGNEVHYFVSFRNHPAFVRADFSPPSAGGMIDLEYYGVSKYELSHHPAPALEAAQAFFRRLDFDVRVDTTRIHARYDKERARDLDDLCARAGALFRLLPYLMDLDWVIGNLDLSREARREVSRAWADFFTRWGVVPLGQLLSENRRGIALRQEPHPEGPRESIWRGAAPYADRFTVQAQPELNAWLEESLRTRGLSAIGNGWSGLTQLELESSVLGRIREAVARGEIIVSDGMLEPASPDRFERLHEARWFALLLAEKKPRLLEAARVAHVVSSVERFLGFETTGAVNGHRVQRARLALTGESLTFLVLRDDDGIARVASFVHGDVLYRSRASGAGSWTDNACCDATALAALLRSRNFLSPGPDEPVDAKMPTLLEIFGRSGRGFAQRDEGDCFLTGLRASPGHAVGLARLGCERRAPRDLEGGILVADRLSPEDGPFLMRASGVVCTGGGVLSHAGLLAAHFSRPAVLIDAEWQAASGSAVLRYEAVEYADTMKWIPPHDVVERRRLASHDAFIRDGDLLDVDADEGLVRILGQDRETMALHEALRQLSAAEARLAQTGDGERVLIERGRRIRARHQLERLLPQVSRPDLQSYAVRRLLEPCAAPAERANLLRTVLEGSRGEPVRRRALDVLRRLETRRAQARGILWSRLPLSEDRFELLSLRLRLLREEASLASARAVLAGCAVSEPGAGGETDSTADTVALDEAVAERLTAVADRTAAHLAAATAAGEWPHVRNLAASLARDATVLPEVQRWWGSVRDVQAQLAERDARVLNERRGAIVFSADAGVELQPLIGAKAANLAELARLEPNVAVPPWFAITDAAFRRALALRPPPGPHASAHATSMHDAIESIVRGVGPDDRQRSHAIAALWDRLELPPNLIDEIAVAYRALEAGAADDPDAVRDRNGRLLVAVRSSSVEEDAPEAARAGEFDTFLFISGEEELLAHVRRAWSGFWTPRALHTRAMSGLGAGRPGGGVLVQKIVQARAAGVLQTINVADAEPREMVVNVAFGLGSGVVSGTVAADHVTIAKDRPGMPLRFKYAVADKRQRIVFDARRGLGTAVAETLYHQRMRGALEYAEIVELVEVATRLEERWQQALDIEFAFDARRLWLLQARPVPPFHAAWRDTARQHSLARRSHS